MNIALWLVQTLLALAFLMSGLMKVLQYEKTKAGMAWMNDVPKGLVISPQPSISSAVSIRGSW